MSMERLFEPFPPEEIEWRVGSTNKDKTQGLALAYLTARHVMDRLDEVVGAANWQTRYEVHGSKTICYLSIKIGDEWVVKADGAGDTDIEADKGGISDALKRAAVLWGIGRYLYSTDAVWVSIQQRGRSYVIAKGQEAKLIGALKRAADPAPIEKKSAYQMKQDAAADGEPNDWEAFLNTRAKCDTLDKLNRFEAKLEQVQFQVWPQGYIDSAREEIAKVREFLTNAKETFEVAE